MKSALLNLDIWNVINSYAYPFQKTRICSQYWDCEAAIFCKHYSLIMNSPYLLRVVHCPVEKIIATDDIDIIKRYFSLRQSEKRVFCKQSRSDQFNSNCVFHIAWSNGVSARVCAYLLTDVCSCEYNGCVTTCKNRNLLKYIIRDLELDLLESLENCFTFENRNNMLHTISKNLEEIAKMEKGNNSGTDRKALIKNKLLPVVLWLHNFIIRKYPDIDMSVFYDRCLSLACIFQDRELTRWLCKTIPPHSSVRNNDTIKLVTPTDLYILDLLYSNQIVYLTHVRNFICISHLIENDGLDAIKWLIEKYPKITETFPMYQWELLIHRNTETAKFILNKCYKDSIMIILEISLIYDDDRKISDIYQLFSDAMRAEQAVQKNSSNRDSLLDFRVLVSEHPPKTKSIIEFICSEQDVLKVILYESMKRGDIRSARFVVSQFTDVDTVTSALRQLVEMDLCEYGQFIILFYRMVGHKFDHITVRKSLMRYSTNFHRQWKHPKNLHKLSALINWHWYTFTYDIIQVETLSGCNDVDFISSLPISLISPRRYDILKICGPKVLRWLTDNYGIDHCAESAKLTWQKIHNYIWAHLNTKDIRNRDEILYRFIDIISRRVDLRLLMQDLEEHGF